MCVCVFGWRRLVVPFGSRVCFWSCSCQVETDVRPVSHLRQLTLDKIVNSEKDISGRAGVFTVRCEEWYRSDNRTLEGARRQRFWDVVRDSGQNVEKVETYPGFSFNCGGGDQRYYTILDLFTHWEAGDAYEIPGIVWHISKLYATATTAAHEAEMGY